MRWRAALCLLGAAACSKPSSAPTPPPDQAAELGGAIAARASVGAHSDAIPTFLVGAVAAEQRIEKSDAVRKLVDDAVAAVAARERGLDRVPPASWLLVAARGRIAADRIRSEAHGAGPPTDDEVKQLTERHWREVDRPASVRVVHAVVKRPPKDDPALRDRATRLAARLHESLAETPTEDFVNTAEKVPHDEDLSVVAEVLSPFTDDGTSIEGPTTFDPTFVRAAFELAKAGDTSGVVATKFGWHVIRLVERLPEQRMPFESRRIAFSEEVYALRARQALDARLGALRAANAVSIAPTAEALMRGVMARVDEPTAGAR